MENEYSSLFNELVGKAPDEAESRRIMSRIRIAVDGEADRLAKIEELPLGTAIETAVQLIQKTLKDLRSTKDLAEGCVLLAQLEHGSILQITLARALRRKFERDVIGQL